MKKLFPIIIFFGIVSSFTFAALAQSAMVGEKDAAELRKIYRDIDEADKKLVLELIEKYLGEDYSVETGGERLNKKQVIERLKTFYGAVKEITEAKSTIEKIELIEGRYAVQVDSITVGKFVLPDGKIADFLFTSKTTDYWRKGKGNKWQQTTQIDRGTKILIDGKEPSDD